MAHRFFMVDKNVELWRTSNIAVLLNAADSSRDAEFELGILCFQVEPGTVLYQEETGVPFSQGSAPGAVFEQQDAPGGAQPPKRKLEDSTVELMAKISKTPDSSPFSKSKQKYSSFIEHISERLTDMADNMALHCQKLMIDAMFDGDFGILNRTSRIVTDFEEPWVAPPPEQQSRYGCILMYCENDDNANTISLPDNESDHDTMILDSYMEALRDI